MVDTHSIINKIEFEHRGKENPIIVITTLETPGITSCRRDGNTTRQIDFAIEQLNKGNIVCCFDHYKNGSHEQANEDLMRKVVEKFTNGFTESANYNKAIYAVYPKGYVPTVKKFTY